MRFTVPDDNGMFGLRDVYGKRVYGAEFKNRVFMLSSDIFLNDGFVERVVYSVIEYSTGMTLGMGESKVTALSNARSLIRSLKDSGRWSLEMRKRVPLLYSRRKTLKLEIIKFQQEWDNRKVTNIVPARRRKVFHKSDGKCHYCQISLDLHGDWHIEHQMPRSRGGSDRLENMVASCIPCNIKKGTKTAEEFQAA